MENALNLNKVLIDDKNNINIKIMEKLQDLQLENKLLTEYLEQKEADMQYAFEAFQKIIKIALDFYALLHLYDKVDNAILLEHDLFEFLTEKVKENFKNIDFADFQASYKERQREFEKTFNERNLAN